MVLRSLVLLVAVVPVANEPALPDIVAALNGDDPAIRRSAVHTVARMGSSAAQVLPALERALRREAQFVGDPSGEVDWLAIDDILVAFTRVGEASLPALTRAASTPWCDLDAEPLTAPFKCGDDDAWLRGKIFGAIEDMGRVAVPTLSNLLSDDEPWIRMVSAECLGRIGPDAATAAPALTRALSDADDQVRRSAAKALASVEAR